MDDLEKISKQENPVVQRTMLEDHIYKRSFASEYGEKDAVRIARSLMLKYSSNYEILIDLLRSQEAFQLEVDEIMAVFSPTSTSLSPPLALPSSPFPCISTLDLVVPETPPIRVLKFRQLSDEGASMNPTCLYCYDPDPLQADERSLRLGCRCSIHYSCLIGYIYSSLGDRFFLTKDFFCKTICLIVLFICCQYYQLVV